ncbi:MAG: hypothetical protein P4M11_03260 [Candidatus Pacebacteria bacterium]|nr:hypothetical protein [Candidatus Paceibacterota bacterium]
MKDSREQDAESEKEKEKQVDDDEEEDESGMATSTSAYSSIIMTGLFIAACVLENPMEQLYNMRYGIGVAYMYT